GMHGALDVVGRQPADERARSGRHQRDQHPAHALTRLLRLARLHSKLLLSLHQAFEVPEILFDLFPGDLGDAVQHLAGFAAWRRVFETQPHFRLPVTRRRKLDRAGVVRTAGAAPGDAPIRLLVGHFRVPLRFGAEDARYPVVAIAAQLLHRLHVAHEVGKAREIAPAAIHLFDGSRHFDTILKYQTLARLLNWICL